MGALLGNVAASTVAGEAADASIADAAANAVGKSSISPFVGMQMEAWDMFSQMFNAEQQRVNPAPTAAPAPSAGTPENPTATKPTGNRGALGLPAVNRIDENGNIIPLTPQELANLGAASGSDNVTWGFADGGTVPNALQKLFPQNIWDQTRKSREQTAGTQGESSGGITINVNASPAPAPTPAPATQEADVWTKMLEEAKKRGYADGTTSAKPRSVAGDIKSGGKIGGPQSKDGRDNQFIKVAGGEGILPVDVMQVPGVEELVHELIATYHTPVNK